VPVAGPLLERPFQAMAAVPLRNRPYGRSAKFHDLRHFGGTPPGKEPPRRRRAENHAHLPAAAVQKSVHGPPVFRFEMKCLAGRPMPKHAKTYPNGIVYYDFQAVIDLVGALRAESVEDDGVTGHREPGGQ
jgi:hypothetical protein